MSFVLSCCSTADLSKAHFAARDIHYICFHFALDGKDYLDDLGESIPFDKFYQAMTDGAETRTSQVNVSEFVEYFSKFCAAGQDVLHLTLSSGISGVINSAQSAAALVMEQYPGRKVYVVDSLGASSGYGLLMDRLADLRDEGMSLEEYNRNNAVEGIQALPKARGHANVHRMVTRDIQDLGVNGLTIIHDIGTQLVGKMDGCTVCRKCERNCPEKALTISDDGVATVQTKNCLGTAGYRCERECPSKVFKYGTLRLAEKA